MFQTKEKDKISEKQLSEAEISNLRNKEFMGVSLVTQWLRIHLLMQGTWVRALDKEDPTCRAATKPVCHNY